MLILTPPSMKEIQQAITAERCRRSLYSFTKEFWSILEPGTPFIESWYTEAICSHLQAVNDGLFTNLIICIPPGFAKSTIVSVMWFCHTWLTLPYIRFLYGSYDERLTFRDAGRCKDIINSNKYKKLFNPEWSIKAKTDGTSFFSNSLHGSRKTYYMTSTKKTGWRGEYLVVDDPLSAESRYDSSIKKKVIDTWDSTLWSRVNRSHHHAFVVIMQRLSEDDLVGHILEKYGDDYVKLILPNEYDPKTKCTTPIFEDPRTEEGELLCPQLLSKSKTEEAKRRLGRVDYGAQYLLQPYPAGGDRFESQYFQYWDYAPGSPLLIRLHHRNGTNTPTIEHTRIDMLERFLSLDSALTDKKTSDWSSFGLWARTNNGELILLHRVKVKLNEPNLVAAVGEVYKMIQWGRNPPSYIAVEINGLGIAVAQNLKAAGYPVKEVQVSKDKVVMSGNAVARIQGGQLFLPHPDVYPWMIDLTRELLAFPNGKNDDDVSMICIAANDMFAQSMMTPREITTLNPTQKPAKFNPLKTQVNLEKRHLFGADKMTDNMGRGRIDGDRNGNGNGNRNR